MKTQITDQRVPGAPAGELVSFIEDTGLEIWLMDDGTIILNGPAETMALARLRLESMLPDVPVTKVRPN